MNRQTLRRVAWFAAPSIEWLTLAVLLVAAIPPILIRHQSLTIVSALNLLDDSWLLDSSYKAAGGIWFGRDVAFTYGPLFQWLSSAPSRWLGTSMGAIYATWYTLPWLAIIVATFLTVRLLLPQAAPWRRALLVALAVVFWSAPDLRVSVALLAFAVFVRMADGVVGPENTVALRGIMAAALCIAGFLISADTGLYCVAALLLCVAATAIIRRRGKRTAGLVIIAALFFLLLMLATNVWMASALDFRFWRSSLAIANGYRWFEPLPMIKENKRLLLEALALGIVVFGVAWRWRRPDGAWTRRPAFLLAGFCLAFLMMQSSLVRSDRGHVILGIYPMIFLCGSIVAEEVESRRLLTMALPGALVIATLVMAHPFGMFVPGNVLTRWRQIAHPIAACPEGWQEFDSTCFRPEDAELVRDVAKYVDEKGAPDSAIAVFPYETALGLAARRQVAGGVLQSYLVNGPYLTGLELVGLRRANPQLGLYLPDGMISMPLDGVPNFTRSPEVWFYFLQHYRAESGPAPGVLGLLRDDGRDRRFVIEREKVAEVAGPVRITKRSTALEVGTVKWPAAGADFLKLRLRVEYPPWWRLRKPSRLTLEMSFADGLEKSIQFVVEPNRASDVWVYPWDDREMGRYFSAEQSDWRSERRPVLTGMKLLITPFDWISVVPSRVSVEDIEAVRVGLR